MRTSNRATPKRMRLSRLAACLTGLSFVFVLSACGPDTPEPHPDSPEIPPSVEQDSPSAAADVDVDMQSLPAATIDADGLAGAESVQDDSLSLAGLGNLRIGQPVLAGSGWEERGAQASDVCRTVSSPDFTGVYAIVIDGVVHRISIGQNSDVELDGLSTGATEEAVWDKFPGLTEEAHKYESSPAKYLTSPDASESDSAVRFEIGSEGTLKFIHVGLMPALGFVEGCS